MKYDLVCFGEVLYDIYPETERQENLKKEARKVLSGAPLTTASIASKLGLKTGIISAINNNPKEEIKKIEKEISSRNVHSLLQTNSKPTGESIISLDKNKIPKFKIKKDVAYDYIKYNKELKNLETKYFCFGTLAQRNKKSRETLQKLLKNLKSKSFSEKNKIKTIYDVNIRKRFPWKKIFKQCLPYTDILKINKPELNEMKKLLNIKKTEKLLDKVDYVFVTRGNKGASVYYKSKNDSSKTEKISLPIKKVNVKDTTGCGDAFIAGMVYGMIKKSKMRKVLQTALKVSVKTASHVGAYKKDVNYK